VRRGALLGALLVALAGAGISAYAVTRPQPDPQALQDGCGRDAAAQFKRDQPEWVYVNDHETKAGDAPPPQQSATGVVNSPAPEAFLAIHPTPVDNPVSHDAYDVNANIRVDSSSAPLVGGDEEAGTGNFEGEGEERGRLHVELEQSEIPSSMWPEAGDRVTVVGSWIWDCGHWTPGGERTELHPFHALLVNRNPGGVSPASPYGESEGDVFFTNAATPAGIQEDCAHRAKGDAAAFKSCESAPNRYEDYSGMDPLRLSVPAPPKPSPRARAYVRVVDAGSTGAMPPKVVLVGRRVEVRLPLPAGDRKRVAAYRVLVGWRPTPARALPQHLHVAVTGVLARRAMDPSCPFDMPSCGSVETTQSGQIGTAPGEFAFYWDVAGVWREWSPAVLRLGDGQVGHPRVAADVYVSRGRPWRLFVFARECDFGTLSFSDPNRPVFPCPKNGEFGNLAGDDRPGIVVVPFRSPVAAVGARRANPLRADTTCPPANKLGCYELRYRVSLVQDAAARAAKMR
jgi:hypothetical protein